MKIRLMGETEQVADAAATIADTFTLVSFSGPHPCRGRATRVRLYLEVTPVPRDERIPPGLDHPNAPADRDNPVPCWWCQGHGCTPCGGSGLVPAWIHENGMEH